MIQQLKNSQFTLKPSEIKALFHNAGSFRNRCILKLLAYCGLRRFEVVNITIPDINFPAKSVRIVGKGGKLAVLPLPGELVDDIQHYLNNRLTGWLFPSPINPKEHLSIGHVNKIVAKAGFKAGVKHPNPARKKINPHLLRHSCARILKNNGMPLESVQAIMRHSKFETTMSCYGTKSQSDIQEDYEEYMKI